MEGWIKCKTLFKFVYKESVWLSCAVWSPERDRSARVLRCTARDDPLRSLLSLTQYDDLRQLGDPAIELLLDPPSCNCAQISQLLSA